MEVPKKIKKLIQESGFLNSLAVAKNQKIRDWLEKKKIDNDTVLDQLIDCIEYGGNKSEDFIQFLAGYEKEIKKC